MTSDTDSICKLMRDEVRGGIYRLVPIVILIVTPQGRDSLVRAVVLSL